ncbi:hypothetical protein [Streptomyces sp. ODS28]|uniref:hypothetical protein n=1 Tax=Streptomyces sp. ODS28 TaxID=3136688 RepID=UPI0031EB57A6
MDNRVRAAACAAGLLLAVAACQQPRTEQAHADQARTDQARTDQRRPESGRADTTFLARGECSTRGGGPFREVSCGSEHAAAKVVSRYEGSRAKGPLCPAHTDFVLHVSERMPRADEDGDGSVPRGYACMRNLEPPHPGDPGRGGGPRTVAGDCVYTSRRGEVRETACDGSGSRAPEYRVATAAATRAQCPPGTTLFVGLEGPEPVGCARGVTR